MCEFMDYVFKIGGKEGMIEFNVYASKMERTWGGRERLLDDLKFIVCCEDKGEWGSVKGSGGPRSCYSCFM